MPRGKRVAWGDVRMVGGGGWWRGGGEMQIVKSRDRVHDPKLLMANSAVAEMGPVNFDGC